jgi:PAS domain S-box-containing protein
VNQPGAVDPTKLLEGPGLHATQNEFLRVLHELRTREDEAKLHVEELRRLEEELQTARDNLFELYELAPVGYATLGPDGRVLAANLALSKLLCTDRRRLIGRKLDERMTASDRVQLATFCEGIRRGGLNQGSVKVMLGCGERSVPVLIKAGATDLRDNGLRVAIVDVTGIERADERVREQEARLNAVFETVIDGVITVGGNGKIISCNAAAARIFRTSRAWLTGLVVTRLIPDFERVVGRGRSELVAQRSNGESFPVEVGVAVMRSGPQPELVGVIRDVSERRQRESELREALERFQQIAEGIDDAIYVVDANTRKTLYVSPAFETIYGRSAAEAELEPWPRLAWVHEEDRERVGATTSTVAETGSLDMQYRIVRPDGTVRTIRNRAFLMREQRRLTGILHDMTDELALQAELRQAQRLEAIGTLASGVAHDFNNLLMGVGGCAQLALRRLDPEHEAYVYLRRAVDAIMRGASLTRQILRFSDTRRSTEEPIELDAVVSGARDLIHSLVGEQIALTVVTGAPGLLIAADSGDIEQMLLNLASNARDAMPDGGALVFRTEPQQGGMITLSVKDTGVGMDEETKRRIFEPFFTTKEIGKGTGLGLSTVFAVVRRMGGSIGIDSAPGAGTTFHLKLPVVVSTPNSERGEDEARRGQGQTVLIVDDDPLVRLTVETHVESLGYRAVTAGSVADALKLYTDRGQPVDLVLTDIMMPGLLGSDLARILAKSAPSLAVVYMSAHPWQELVRQGHLTENARLLAKPFDARDLGAALYQALRDKPSSRPPKPLRVFVVDDEPDVVDALRDLLEMEGHLVGTSLGSNEAAEGILSFVPDIVLCDLNIEESLSGIELVKKLRDEPALEKTAFLAVTGMSASDSRRLALDAGFEDVLVKPLDFGKLSRVLRSHVKR